MSWQAERYHDISVGHRVHNHESKCAYLHGHNYRIHFFCKGGLDSVGRVIDFSEIKSRLCMWLEDNWDHKFLAWENDPIMKMINYYVVHPETCEDNGKALDTLDQSIVWVPFNPTAENIAEYLVKVIGPQQLAGTGIELVLCRVDETRKCSASYSV